MAKTIMSIDDSTSLRQVVNIALSEAGYEVLEACDGLDALSKRKGQKVHLMICDVNMPNMDGITFLKAVRGLSPNTTRSSRIRRRSPNSRRPSI